MPKPFRRIRTIITPRMAAALATAVGASLLLTIKLYNLTPGLAAVERPLPPLRATLSALWNAPFEAPLLVAQFVIAGISQTGGIAVSRAPSVLLGLALIGMFYWLVKAWYGQRLAIFGVLLLITAPWFLHVARLATSDIVYPLSMCTVLILAAIWHRREWSKRTLYFGALTAAALLYLPGMIYLLLTILFFERKHVFKQLRRFGGHTVLAAVFGLTILIPLMHALLLNPHSYKQLLGFAGGLPEPLPFASAFVRSWQYIFVGGLVDPVHNLESLPLINMFIGLSFVIGVYLYAKHPKAVRTKQLASLWIVGTALVALQGPVSYSLVLPIVLVLAIGGIGYLLHLWLKTFPRNPYARNFGIALIGLVVLLAVAYNLRNYYLAWPNNESTRGAFTRQL